MLVCTRTLRASGYWNMCVVLYESVNTAMDRGSGGRPTTECCPVSLAGGAILTPSALGRLRAADDAGTKPSGRRSGASSDVIHESVCAMMRGAPLGHKRRRAGGLFLTRFENLLTPSSLL